MLYIFAGIMIAICGSAYLRTPADEPVVRLMWGTGAGLAAAAALLGLAFDALTPSPY